MSLTRLLIRIVLWMVVPLTISTLANASSLVAGAGRENIPSAFGDPIGSWGQAQADSWGFDAASATALYLSDGKESVTIVTVDTILIYEYQTEHVKESLRAQGRPDNLFLIASHTHATPSVFAAGDVVDLRIRAAILSAVVKAQDAARPAKLGGGKGHYIAAFNRIPRTPLPTKEVFSICKEDLLNGWRAAHPNDPVDDSVSVWRILSTNNEPIATLFNYAAHPVTFGGAGNRWGTPGYPAQARRVVEAGLGGLSLFVQGFGGDISTPCAVLTGTDAHLAMMRFGAGLGSVVLSVAENVDKFDADLPISSSTEELAYSDQCPELGRAPSLQIGAISFGQKLAFVGVSGEPFSTIGRDIRTSLNEKFGYELDIVAGYTNSAIGYVPDQAVWGSGAYSTVKVPGVRVMCVPRDTAGRIVAEVERQLEALD